jgi:putative protease
MKDLNTFNHLEELLSSNIDSLKIEGRMKSPYYVGYVTRLYRILIDKYYNGQPLSLTDEEIFNLKKLFNREFTDGYLFNASDITNIKSPNHIGIKIGEVVSTDQNFISIKITNDILNQEDAIRFKKANVGMVVNKLYNSKKLLVNHIDKNSICLIDNKMDVKIKKGDIVLKTIDKKLITDLSKYESKKIEISFNAEFKINQNFKVTISDGINTFTAFGPIVDLAKTHEVLKEDIEKLLTKLGNTPFLCSHIDINKDDNIFVSLKSINEVRRQLIEQLIKAREGEARKITYNVVEKDRKNTINNNITINALVRNEEQLKCCLDNNVNKIYVTDYELYKKYKNNKTIYYRLDQVMNHFLDFDHDNLLVGELGSVNKYHLNNELITDYYLNVTNSKSIEFLNDMNVKQVTLSVELKYQDICDIMKKNYNVELIVYGRLELMIMKYCPFKKIFNSCINCNNIKDKFYLIDKNNNKYPIISSKCLTHIMHYKNINLIAEISQYRKINITNFRLEFFDENNLEITNIINLVKKELNIK